jgi:hypothetical protein
VVGLRAIGGDVEVALESINVPSYVIDRTLGVHSRLEAVAFVRREHLVGT